MCMNKDLLSSVISHKPVLIHTKLFIHKCAVDQRKKEEIRQCRNQHPLFCSTLYCLCRCSEQSCLLMQSSCSTAVEQAVPRLFTQAGSTSMLGEKQPQSLVLLRWLICGGMSLFINSRESLGWLSKCLKQVTQARWGSVPEFLPSQQ